MSRTEILKKLGFTVPVSRKKRVIILSDIAAEADDAFAIVHHLLSTSEDVVGIIAVNYEWRYRTVGPMLEKQLAASENTDPAFRTAAENFLAMRLHTVQKSMEVGKQLLSLMHMEEIPLLRGAPDCMYDIQHPPVSEGSQFIVQEAMKEAEEPLYLALQGSLTDLAAAYLSKPEIAGRIRAAIWIGGASYPEGGPEANLQQDIKAAQTVFASPIPLWQIPVDVYGGMNFSLAEMAAKVGMTGDVGRYLLARTLQVNDWYGRTGMSGDFPQGESWSLGDSPTVAALLENTAGQKRRKQKTPWIRDDMRYEENPDGKEIYVYEGIDRRLLLDDFTAKLYLCYGKQE